MKNELKWAIRFLIYFVLLLIIDYYFFFQKTLEVEVYKQHLIKILEAIFISLSLICVGIYFWKQKKEVK